MAEGQKNRSVKQNIEPDTNLHIQVRVKHDTGGMTGEQGNNRFLGDQNRTI